MNKLDFWLILTSVCGELSVSILRWHNFSSGTEVQVVTSGRVLRLLRILRLFRSFRQILATLTEILPILFVVTAFLGVVFYVFAILGMDLWAGKLIPDNFVDVITDNPYAINHYWGLNFDTVGRAYITLFVLLVVNNWFIIMEGCIHVSSQWAVVYFVVFYLVAVIVVTNVALAFLLSVFNLYFDDQEV